MTDIRETVKRVLDHTNVDHITTNDAVDELTEQLVAALREPMLPDAVPDCPFCQKIAGGSVQVDGRYEVASFEPLNPVTPGHVLFTPVKHTEANWLVTDERVAKCIGAAIRYGHSMRTPYNLIVNFGAAATQTIDHVHVHYVPRRTDDGLALPWTGQTR